MLRGQNASLQINVSLDQTQRPLLAFWDDLSTLSAFLTEGVTDLTEPTYSEATGVSYSAPVTLPVLQSADVVAFGRDFVAVQVLLPFSVAAVANYNDAVEAGSRRDLPLVLIDVSGSVGRTGQNAMRAIRDSLISQGLGDQAVSVLVVDQGNRTGGPYTLSIDQALFSPPAAVDESPVAARLKDVDPELDRLVMVLADGDYSLPQHGVFEAASTLLAIQITPELKTELEDSVGRISVAQYLANSAIWDKDIDIIATQFARLSAAESNLQNSRETFAKDQRFAGFLPLWPKDLGPLDIIDAETPVPEAATWVGVPAWTLLNRSLMTLRQP